MNSTPTTVRRLPPDRCARIVGEVVAYHPASTTRVTVPVRVYAARVRLLDEATLDPVEIATSAVVATGLIVGRVVAHGHDPDEVAGSIVWTGHTTRYVMT